MGFLNNNSLWAVRAPAVLVTLALTMSITIFGPIKPAQAWTDGACTTNDGVTVIVDYARLGGGTIVRCAQGSQSTGISALKNAGFPLEYVQEKSSFGLFICRIGGKPTKSEDPCKITPPANAYWSYWHSPRGGKWQYSNFGAGNRTPPTGSVEGWRFSNGSYATPNVAPPAPLPSGGSNKPNKPSRSPSTSSSGANSGSGGSTTGSSVNPSNTPSSGSSNSSPLSDGNKDNKKSKAKDAKKQDNVAASAQAADQAAISDMNSSDVEASGSVVGVLATLAAFAGLLIVGAIVWMRRFRER